MKYAYSNARSREADRLTIAGGTPSAELMERAGTALAECVKRAMAELGVKDALFVCGGGNNGGDGFVAARILSEAAEQTAVLCLAERFSEDCAREKARYRGEVFGRIPRRRYALVVDCILGTGLTRAPEGDCAALIEFINGSGAYVISADLPSGLAENGVAFAPCVRADETVCMGSLKSALLMADGADTAGKITVADIGIPIEARGAEIWEDGDVAKQFPPKKSNTHKGSFGSACILAGGTYSGAAFLSAGACLKSGAGYTRLCVTEEVFPHAIGRLPACVLRPFHAIDGEILASDCIAVGMGTGMSERLYVIMTELLSEYTGTLLLDADALNTLAHYGKEILKKKSCKVILTPHPKEFSRLTGRGVKEIFADAVNAAEAFAREFEVTVVLKNNRSIVTDGTRTAINPTGSPALAKGGSGDVLAGFLAGTAARGIAPFEAACTAAYVCGRAGELAAEEMGEYAPDATDLIGFLPRAMQSVLPKKRHA